MSLSRSLSPPPFRGGKGGNAVAIVVSPAAAKTENQKDDYDRGRQKLNTELLNRVSVLRFVRDEIPRIAY